MVAHRAKMLFWQEAATISDLKASLDMDNISITSTDTILGFLGRLTEKTFETLNMIKGGRSDKPYLILIGSSQKLPAFVDVTALSADVKKIIAACWPGPLTIVFRAKPGMPKYLISKDGTIAMRCPRHEGLQKLLSLVDGLFSTSANKSAQTPPQTIKEIDAQLLPHIDYLVVDYKEAQAQVPSTMIDVSGPHIKVLRAGAYSVEKMEQLSGVVLPR